MTTKTHFVLSTLTSSQRYVNYANGANDLPLPLGDGVLVQGGAGVADNAIITPAGVVTAISDEDKLYLEANEAFKFHRERGFVQISEHKVDPDKFAADMASRDGSAPLVPADLGPDEKAKAEAGTPKRK